MLAVTKKKLVVLSLLLAGLSASLQAQTYWLNIPGAYNKVDEQYHPSISIPTSGHDACSDAVVEYAKQNLVHYIGCDVKPLPDAKNINASLRHR